MRTTHDALGLQSLNGKLPWGGVDRSIFDFIHVQDKYEFGRLEMMTALDIQVAFFCPAAFLGLLVHELM